MPRRFVFVVVWLVGVAAAMLLATAAVGLVGDRVTSRPVPRLSQASVGATLRAGGDSSASSVPGVDEQAAAISAGSSTAVGVVPGGRGAEGSGADQSVASSSGGGPSPSSSSTGSGGNGDPSQSSGSSGSSDSSGSGSGGGGDRGGPGPTAATVAPAPVSATFTAEGGSVGVTCVGSTINRDFVAPNAGFALDPSGSNGPGEVDVRFRSTSGGRDSRIRVTCPSGAPVERIDA